MNDLVGTIIVYLLAIGTLVLALDAWRRLSDLEDRVQESMLKLGGA